MLTIPQQINSTRNGNQGFFAMLAELKVMLAEHKADVLKAVDDKIKDKIPGLSSILESVKGKDADPEEVAKLLLESPEFVDKLKEYLPTETDIKNYLKPLIPKVKDGYTPKKGVDYNDGKDANVDEITRRVSLLMPLAKQGMQGDAGKDGSPDTGEEIAQKLNTLEDVVDQKVIKGLGKWQKMVMRMIKESIKPYLHGGGSSTSTSTGSGYQLTTSGTVNGTNKVFAFATAPNAIVVDTVPMKRLQADGVTANWTGTTTITLTVAPNDVIFGIA